MVESKGPESKGIESKDLSSKDAVSKNSNLKDSSPKDSNLKDSSMRDPRLKDSGPKDSNPIVSDQEKSSIESFSKDIMSSSQWPSQPLTAIGEDVAGDQMPTDKQHENVQNAEHETLIDDEVAGDGEFLTTIFEHMEPYIDTFAVYKRLLEAGFTPSQSDEVINLLIAQLNTKLSKLTTKYSQIYELENEQYLFESAQQELGVDITRNRENHINEAINQINALERDYAVLSDELNNHLIEMKNDIEIAINDQKSENTLMSKRIMLRIQETNHKITTEITMAMRSEIESLRWHLSRWGVITILTCVITAFISFYMYRSQLQKKLAKAKTEFAPLFIYEPSELDDDDYHADLDPDSL